MPGGLDGDNNVGMEVIKESLGMTDEDLAPESQELDWGDGQDDVGVDEHDDEQAPEQVHRQERDEREPRREQREGREAPQRVDPLKQNTLKFDPRATFRQDAKGNLVDTRTGEIIARAGSEARIYQRVHKQASDYVRAVSGNIQNQMAQERGKLERAVEIGLGFEKELSDLKGYVKSINAYELPKEHLIEAAGLWKQAQSDPIGVLKNLLTRASLSGIDISQLGLNNSQLDAKTLVDTLRKEIQQGIKPVSDYTTQQQKAQEEKQVESRYLQQAEKLVGDFFGRTKEALPYTHIFQAVLQQPRFQHMSLGEIWDKIQLHLIRNGVDPRQAPSRTQRQRLNGNPEGNAPRAPSRSLPSGQGMAPSGGDMSGRSNAGPAHPSMSYDAIIREVLGKAQR